MCKLSIMKILAIFVVLALEKASGIIYRLNETEYRRLPPLIQLDEFYPCLQQPGDVYCYVDGKIVPDDTSELYRIIHEYSAYDITHYDHTVVHRGLCVKKTCQEHLSNFTTLDDSLEACINGSLYRGHQLQAKLIKDKVFCTEFEEKVDLDAGDYVVALVIILILVLGVLATAYDHCCSSKCNNIGRKMLLSFSLKRNWQRLVAPSGEGPEPRLTRLKSLNGIKALSTALVILGHSPLSAVINTNNPEFIESTYSNPLYAILYNGTLIVQTFFLISGFLLSFNILLMGEKKKISWDTLPKGIILRWLRLTPAYALILGFISTWAGHIDNGPLWKPVVETEVIDCRRDWYLNLLYINNYHTNSQCMAHAWYLAADMQLSVLGLAIFCLVTSPRGRRIAVSILFAIGLLTPALHTYIQNLPSILIVRPEVGRNFFVVDPTFNNLYTPGHTNIVCFALGLGLGMFIYNLQLNDFDVMKYQKYRPIFYATVPCGVLAVMTGYVFYIDGIEIPLAVRVIYSSAIKLVFGLLLSIFITGNIFKLEKLYRGILEWRGWAPMGRISYCAYLAHVTVIRTSTANHTSLVHSSFYQILLNYLGVLSISFLVAVPFFLLVEAPFAQLVKTCFNPGSKASNLDRNKSVSLATQVVVLGSKETIDVKL